MKMNQCARLVEIVSLMMATSVVTAKPAAPRIDPLLSSTVLDIVSVHVFDDARPGPPSNRNMIECAIYVSALRDGMRKFISEKPNPFDVKIDSQTVSAAAMRYFGKKVRHQTVGDWKYKAGFYHGESVLFEQLDFEKIKRMRVANLTNGQITAYADTEDAMASSDSEQEVVIQSKMTFRPIVTRGKKRYILTSYQTLLKQH